MASREAARSAGYSESFARVAAHRIGGNPFMTQAIAAIRREGMKAVVYDLAVAMKEAEDQHSSRRRAAPSGTALQIPQMLKAGTIDTTKPAS
jgi:phage terminase small subunit